MRIDIGFPGRNVRWSIDPSSDLAHDFEAGIDDRSKTALSRRAQRDRIAPVFTRIFSSGT
ncbi:hypothetical protein EA472_12755 [Natrarchaeobius oligotrophus]|uniref:Uncharacterized protein n=1 Tax=Natrarchaeobius chitinivorans TaxID=1679083 RepID=A0A3N6M8N6_NATCH|nr:hypothetical protein EA472_12755 [Natrarchaeobius chitinivorans]